METKEIFAKRLVKLREEKEITQQTLADDLGITRQSLSLYEKAERTINIDLIVKIADYFDVSTDYLLGRTTNKTTDIDLQAVCDYTGLSEKAIIFLHTLSNRAKGIEISPTYSQEINDIENFVAEQNYKLSELLSEFPEVRKNFDKYNHDGDNFFECEEWNQALSCFNIIETAPAIIKRIKTKNINHSYQGLQALSAMLCGNDVEEFISNLSLYMFTDFGHVGNNVSITTADICKPNIRASFSFLSKTIGNMLLSEIHNYIRNLKSENIKNVFCSINIEENILKEEGVPIALNNPPQE